MCDWLCATFSQTVLFFQIWGSIIKRFHFFFKQSMPNAHYKGNVIEFFPSKIIEVKLRRQTHKWQLYMTRESVSDE